MTIRPSRHEYPPIWFTPRLAGVVVAQINTLPTRYELGSELLAWAAGGAICAAEGELREVMSILRRLEMEETFIGTLSELYAVSPRPPRQELLEIIGRARCAEAARIFEEEQTDISPPPLPAGPRVRPRIHTRARHPRRLDDEDTEISPPPLPSRWMHEA